MSLISHLLVQGGGGQEVGDQKEVTLSEPKIPREEAGNQPTGIQTPVSVNFTQWGRVNFGLSVMAIVARTADAANGSEEEEEETNGGGP